MYTILLVDDDAVFRAHMKSMMDWESEGFAIVSEARNGREAIEIIEAAGVDIVITDMSMPVINGVELIDYVSEYHKEIQIIALSAYNDFTYVRGSLKSGALDYLLKNRLDKEQLLEILRTAAGRISEKGTRESDRPIVSSEKSAQEFFLLLLSGCAGDRSEIAARLRELGLEGLENGVVAAVTEPDNETLKKTLSENDYYRIMYSIKSIMQESSHSSRGTLVMVIGRGRILVLIPAPEISLHFFQNQYRRMLGDMRDNVKRFLNESVSFGVSSLCRDIVELPSYYERAAKVLESKRFQGKTDFIAETGSELNDKKVITLDMCSEKEIYAALHEKSGTPPEEIVRKLFDGFIEDGCSKEDIQMVLAELLNIATNEMRDNGIPAKQVFHEDSLSYKTLNQFSNLPEMREWFAGVFECLGLLIKNCRVATHYNENTRRATEYMENNYALKISLKDIAKEVNVNSSYLSRLFKKDTGVNIVDYLNKVRLEKSALLIREGKFSLKSIADEVGIQNYNHFFKLFKDHYGVTPGEYRQKAQDD